MSLLPKFEVERPEITAASAEHTNKFPCNIADEKCVFVNIKFGFILHQ